MIEVGRLDPARLVTRRIGLSGLHDALAAMDGYGGSGVTVVDDMGG
jgi:alcohol dehydrogenase